MSRWVELPPEISWSGPPPRYDLDDPKDRLVVYELVLQEGNEAHVREYVDVDQLYDLWDEMYLPVGAETAWADYFERVRETPVRRRWASPTSKRATPTRHSAATNHPSLPLRVGSQMMVRSTATIRTSRTTLATPPR